MDLSTVFQHLGIGIGLGLLVGLQRESVASRLAGVRTFPLVTVLGSVCGLISQSQGGWVIAAGLAALAGIIMMGKVAEFKEGPVDPGLTTEIALLLMFVVGAYLTVGYREVAIALGGGVAVLLQFKGLLHGMVSKLGDDDLKAIMQLALISLVILPVLPNQFFGPYMVLNPRQIWWMVVLIVGISLVGYVAYKFFGSNAGVFWGGIFGGIVSSTAATLSYSKRAAEVPGTERLSAIAIMIASTILFLRLLVIIAAVAPAFFPSASPPILLFLFLMCGISLTLWVRGRDKTTPMPALGNPSNLKPAILFALIYAVTLVCVAAAKEHFGSTGMYTVAGLSGLTDLDAITVSVSQLVGADRLAAAHGWKLIILATMANFVFKGGLILVVGSRALFKKVALPFSLAIVTGMALIYFWPEFA
ncbi:MAG: hypothetical protein H6Q04_571 [Acidobacteria bacterium]|nr:hypothetical protein [Acidobacteriota bacterium]